MDVAAAVDLLEELLELDDDCAVARAAKADARRMVKRILAVVVIKIE